MTEYLKERSFNGRPAGIKEEKSHLFWCEVVYEWPYSNELVRGRGLPLLIDPPPRQPGGTFE